VVYGIDRSPAACQQLYCLRQVLILYHLSRDDLILAAIVWLNHIVAFGIIATVRRGEEAPGFNCLTAVMHMDHYPRHRKDIKKHDRYDKEPFH
jgi:hypothetical protein